MDKLELNVISNVSNINILLEQTTIQLMHLENNLDALEEENAGNIDKVLGYIQIIETKKLIERKLKQIKTVSDVLDPDNYHDDFKAKEWIICSAIDATNSNANEIICGRRHKDCVEIISNIDSIPQETVKDFERGFMTSIGRFVSRQEALVIAIKNDQIFHNIKINEDVGLTSEDIYYDADGTV